MALLLSTTTAFARDNAFQYRSHGSGLCILQSEDTHFIAGCRAFDVDRSELHLGATRVVARNDHAAKDLKTWPKYLGPTRGYSEQVYFSESTSGKDGWATALLTSPDAKSGFAVHYKSKTLPYFTQWKNTVGFEDGYVTGLEPGTGFPNPRSFEEKQGRLVSLDSGEARDFNLKLEGLTSGPRVSQLVNELTQLNHNQIEAMSFDRSS